MDDQEKHEREMNLNAHFCWALAMWGSAEVAREQSNNIVACYGYYYAGFHAGFAFLNTDHTFHMDSMREIKHGKVESWLNDKLPFRLSVDYSLLRQYREATSYLGMDTPANKMCVVRGHPFGFTLDSEGRAINFYAAVQEASGASARLVRHLLAEIEKHCALHGWRGPKRGDSAWLEDYLQEDVLLGVIPRNKEGKNILGRAFSLLNAP